MRIIARESLSSASIDFWLIQKKSLGKVNVVNPINLSLTEHEDCFMLPTPTFSLSIEEAQSVCQTMLDELIKMGYKPNNDKLAGKLEAQETHLKDLQKIVNIFMNVVERKGLD